MYLIREVQQSVRLTSGLHENEIFNLFTVETALLHIKHVNLTGVSFYSLKYSLKRNKWYFDSNGSIVDLEWFFDA